jgi:hypothetical protein
VSFTLDGRPFRAIVDTGSPFLTIPAEADCAEQPRRQAFFGCAPYSAFRGAPIPPSLELYGTTEASVEWRVAELRGLAAQPQPNIVIGAAPRSLVEASGGTFAGLILNGDGRHPTLLGQLSPPITGFVLDGPNLELRLYPATPAGSGAGGGIRSGRVMRAPGSEVVPRSADAVRLIDLRPLGDPVDHIAATATRLLLDGSPVPLSRPLIAVFDSGLSGAILSSQLCDDAPNDTSAARLAAASSLEVVIETESGGRMSLRATRHSTPRLFRVGSQPVPWFPDPSVEPGIVVLGQTFLRDAVLAVDFRTRRALCIQGGAETALAAA